MNRVQQQMMEKELQLGEMSSSIHERQLMLQQSQVRIVELEEGQTQLEEQVKSCFIPIVFNTKPHFSYWCV